MLIVVSGGGGESLASDAGGAADGTVPSESSAGLDGLGRVVDGGEAIESAGARLPAASGAPASPTSTNRVMERATNRISRISQASGKTLSITDIDRRERTEVR